MIKKNIKEERIGMRIEPQLKNQWEQQALKRKMTLTQFIKFCVKTVIQRQDAKNSQKQEE